jgi:hypothetical protein
MERRSIEKIISALNDSGARYLVVGGLAVVAHGHVRFTADLDLLLDLDPQNLKKALAALRGLGYRPRLPVPAEDFNDPDIRERWVREMNLEVFSLFSDQHPATEIDLFASDPLGFNAAFERALRMEVAQGVEATIVSLPDLLKLKRAAGRPQDLLDIEKLEAVGRNDGNDRR